MKRPNSISSQMQNEWPKFVQNEGRALGSFPSQARQISLLVLLLAFLIVGCAPKNHTFAGAVLEPPQVVPDFTLTSANGPVSLSDFAGKYVFIYFGYTFCPDVCPATLVELAQMRKELGDDAERVQVIMVSVDPERDTPAHLADYVSHFDDTFVGLTGTQAEIDAVGVPYGLHYERHEGTAATGYLIDHTARAYLIDPQQQARVAYPFDTDYRDITADLRWLFAQE